VISLTGYDGSRAPQRPVDSAARDHSRYLQRMDDSFSFGHEPKKRRSPVSTKAPRHAAPRAQGPVRARPRPSHAPTATQRKGSFEQTRLLLGILGLFVVAVLVWGFLHFMSASGQEAAAREGEAIDHAQDVQAQLTGTSAIESVQGVYSQVGSFDQVTAQALKQYEPTFSYTDAASGEPNTVSVASTPQGVGLAVASSSGTCLYAYVTVTGVTYGTGSTCTGEAALQASDRAWPPTS
jgi:hypothetical protein